MIMPHTEHMQRSTKAVTMRTTIHQAIPNGLFLDHHEEGEEGGSVGGLVVVWPSGLGLPLVVVPAAAVDRGPEM